MSQEHPLLHINKLLICRSSSILDEEKLTYLSPITCCSVARHRRTSPENQQLVALNHITPRYFLPICRDNHKSPQ